jgi:hypothetical protein
VKYGRSAPDQNGDTSPHSREMQDLTREPAS